MNYKDMTERQYGVEIAALNAAAAAGDAGAMLAAEVLKAQRSLYFLEQDRAKNRRYLRDIGA